ncbi:hypothetical protein Dxin01_02964 [Deinococcus xinjiangensis]|uniref:Uncharacterized protein n=1 Tax=Deinococcus xinjiangensis TaxID=457454 RepID=A0ABP9VD93_9DEIO
MSERPTLSGTENQDAKAFFGPIVTPELASTSPLSQYGGVCTRHC